MRVRALVGALGAVEDLDHGALAGELLLPLDLVRVLEQVPDGPAHRGDVGLEPVRTVDADRVAHGRWTGRRMRA